MMDRPVVVQAALGRRLAHRDGASGSNEELVAEALSAWDAGAAVLALSLPDIDGSGGGRRAELSAVVGAIRSAGCDAVLSLSPGSSLTNGGPLADASDLGVELVSLDCRSTTARGDERAWVASLRERALALSWSGVAVEVQCSEPRDVKRVVELRDAGLLADPLRFQLLIDAHGRGESPVERLARATASLPAGAAWFASAIGLGQLAANMYALVAGGHLRTGLEDNLWLIEDVPATDEQLVARLVRIVDEFDRPLATPDEAREVLRLSGDGGLSHVGEGLVPSLG
jgi:3-keto-5-aminohexanoate cleavage enzyme